MVGAGSVAFGLVVGWWLIMSDTGRASAAATGTAAAAALATTALLAGPAGTVLVLVGLVGGAAAHAAFRRAVRRSLVNGGVR